MIITKGGDKGETSILGKRVPKTDIRIETTGAIDELNASIGIALNHCDEKILTKIQNDLFKIGAEIAGAEQKISQKDIEEIEKETKQIEEKLPKQTGFILPQGTEATSRLHLARTICRRTEIQILKCDEKYPVREEIKIYFNRLSDLLFILARKHNNKEISVTY